MTAEMGVPGSTEPRSVFVKRLLAVALVVNLFFIGLAALSLYQSRLQYDERARTTTQNLSLALAGEIGDAVDKVDLAVQTVSDEVEKQLATGGIDATALNAFIARQTARLPDLGGLRVVNAQGENAYGTDVTPGVRTSVADRAYFIRLRDEPNAGLVVSEPVVGRVSKKLSLIFARRVNHPDGAFAGLVYGAITLEHLLQTFAALDVDKHGAVTLRDEELSFIMRYPEPEGLGDLLGHKNASPEFRKAVKARADFGTYSSTRGFDKIDRVYSYRRIPKRPFYVIVGLAYEDYLTAWRRELAGISALVAFFMIGTLATSWRIHWGWTRQTTAVQALARQEVALRESEERLRFALDTIQIGAWELDLDTHRAHHTPYHDRIFGYATPLPEWTYEMFLEHVLPEDRPDVERKFRDAVATQSNWNFECRIRRTDGEVRWIWAAGQRRMDEREPRKLLAGIVQDITERKKADDSLKRSLSLQRATLESTVDGLLVVDLAEKITDYNQRFIEMWRLPPGIIDSGNDEQTLQFVIDQLQYPEHFLSKVRQLYADPEQSSSDVIKFKDGRTFERYSQPQWMDGVAVGRVWSFRDITARMRAEEALRTSEERYRLLADNAEDFVTMHDVDGHRLYVSPSFYRVTGWTPEEIEASDWRTRVHPDDLLVIDATRAANLRGQVTRIEHRFLCKNGSWMWLDARCRPVVDASGKVREMVLWSRDITARKNAEEALRKNEEKLRQSEKLTAIGQLAGGIAHDFNNQLTSVLGYAEMLVNRLDDPALRRYAENILRAAHRSADLTAQLLAFARKGKYISIPIDFHKLIGETVVLLEHSIDKRIAIQQLLKANPATVSGDPTQLQNVLLNLALNARDAMPNGGELIFATEVVALDEKSCREHPGALTPGQYLKAAVIDTGCGMDKEVQGHIFEPFFTTKGVGKGSGMGLASAYGTLETHRGSITVSSEPGRGTTFTIYLPVLNTKPVDENHADAATPVKGASSILLVSASK